MNSDEPSLNLTVLKQIDSVCGDFERAWTAGAAPRIEEYLAGWDNSSSPQLFEQLLRTEHSLRCDSGQFPSRDEYQQRFPIYAKIIDAVFRETETRADTSHGSAKKAELASFPKAGDSIAEFEIMDHGKEGASGKVYRAWQHRVEREVALKVTRSASHESRPLARLDGHPNIVRIYDHRRVGQFDIVFMEFVDGVTLSEKISEIRDGGTPANWAQQVSEIGAQLGDALEFAHQKRVRHLDVKPANIMLAGNGRVKLLDFNTAQQADFDVTRFGGTRPYMSPEQLDAYEETNDAARNEKIKLLDGRSDIYSLGLVLWELATGIRPNSNVPEGNEGMPSTLFDLPPGLRQVLLKCVQPEPNDRYQTAGDLAHELRLSANSELQSLLYPPEKGWRSVLLKWHLPLLILILLGVAGNGLVTAISIPWNGVVVGGSCEFWLCAGVVNGLMYLLGGIIGIIRGWPATIALRLLQQGTSIEVGPALIARCLNLGDYVGRLSWILWITSAFVWLGLGLVFRLDQGRLMLFCATVFFFGFIAAPLAFFPITFVCVRLLVPRLMRNTHVPLSSNIDRGLSANLVSLPAGTVIVLLIVFSVWMWSDTPNWVLVLLLSVLLLLVSTGFAGAWWCWHAIRADLKLLSLIGRPSSGQLAS